jgi:hypothetical protein
MDPNATWRGQDSYAKKFYPVVVFVVGQAAQNRGKDWDAGVTDTGDAATSSGLDGQYISPWAPEVFILLTHPRLDAPDDEGTTALMKAAARGDYYLVRFLLENGADPARVDKEGRDAAGHAARLGHDDLATFLHDSIPNAPK